MNIKSGSIIIGVAIVAILLIFQATRQSAVTVHLPSELASSGTAFKRIRVAGKVSAGSIDYAVQPKIVLKFAVGNPGQTPHHEEMVNNSELSSNATIPVIYQGLKPDMFAAGRDVILDGDFEGGVFQATRLLTQCPSKYQAAKPGTEEKRSMEQAK